MKDVLLVLAYLLMGGGFMIVFFDWNAHKIVTSLQWGGFGISMIGLLLFLFIMYKKK